MEPREDPAVRYAQLQLTPQLATVLSLGVEEYVAGGVPKLVAEVAIPFDAVEIELDVAPGGGQGRKGEAQGISAEGGYTVWEVGAGLLGDLLRQVWLHHAAGALLDQLFQADAVDQVDRVQDVALGLGHLVAVGIAHQAVNVDLAEGHIAHELEAHHDHPGDPEEDDVEPGDQYTGGVEGLQRLAPLRPAKGGEGPQCGAEPGVEHVLVLSQLEALRQVVSAAHLLFGAAYVDVALVVVPGRDAVAPPDLA